MINIKNIFVNFKSKERNCLFLNCKWHQIVFKIEPYLWSSTVLFLVFCLICIHRCATNLLTWTLLTYQKLLQLRMESSGVFLLINNKLSVYVLLNLMKVIKIDSSLFLFWHLTNSKDISTFIYLKQNKFTLNWCLTVKKTSLCFLPKV